MEPFEAIYCVVEDIVCVVDEDAHQAAIEDGECPNCNEQPIVVVMVTEKK